MTKKQERNKYLVERYPWLLPRDPWTDEPKEDYNYSYVDYDDMPDGWWEAFGEMMCEEIRQELLKFGDEALQNYRLVQAKEKYGAMCWYDNGHPQESNVGDIIGKYSRLSENICVACGKPDVPMTTDGWIMPLCKECYCKGLYNSPEGWEEHAGKNGTAMSTEYKYSRYANGKWNDVVVDISGTAEEIRRKYNEG